MPKPYPTATLWMDPTGSIHAWRGQRKIVRTAKYMAVTKRGNEEAEAYLQGDDALIVSDSLPPHQKEDLENGYTITTHFFCDEYFGTN